MGARSVCLDGALLFPAPRAFALRLWVVNVNGRLRDKRAAAPDQIALAGDLGDVDPHGLCHRLNVRGVVRRRVRLYQGLRVFKRRFSFLSAIIWRSPERNGSAIVAGVLVSSVIAAMLGILGYFNLFVSPELYTEFGRATGTFVDPNVFAPALIFPTLYLLQRCAAQPNQGVWWCAPLIFLLLLAIFLSFSRGAWLNFVVSALFFWGLSYSSGNSSTRRRLVLFSMFTVTMMSAIVFWALSSADVSALFWERFSLTQSYDVAENGRFNNMYNALLAAGENPLGLGPYQWALIAGLMPHNTYVNFFVSGGVIALSGFLLLVVTTLRIGFRAIRFSPPMKNVLIAALAALVGLLVQCLLIDINHWRHFYIIAALVWGLALAADTRGRVGTQVGAGRG